MTRGTPLAVCQTEWVAAALRRGGREVRVEVVSTRGDRSLGGNVALAQGMFTTELSRLLREGSADLAVHSLKDLPLIDEVGLSIVAIPRRELPYDLLLKRSGTGVRLDQLLSADAATAGEGATDPETAFASLPPGAVVGTASPRRQAALLALRPDLIVSATRGSVGRRLEFLEHGAVDGLLLAEAGLRRLYEVGHDLERFRDLVADRLSLSGWPTAPGQGALAVQAKKGGRCEGDEVVLALDHAPTRHAVSLEREILQTLGGGCLRPLGVTCSNGRVSAALAEEPWLEAAEIGLAPAMLRAAGSDSGLELASVVQALTESPQSSEETGTIVYRSASECRLAPYLVVTSGWATTVRLTSALEPKRQEPVRVLALPVTETRPLDTPWPVERIERPERRRQWPWVLVSSPSAAKVLAERATREEIWAELPWCALGEGTARALLAVGHAPNLVARASEGSSFATFIQAHTDTSAVCFVPQSAIARSQLVSELEGGGRQVIAWPAYETVVVPGIELPTGWQAIERVLYTAPSAVSAWQAAGLPWPQKAWALGRTTANELEDRGVELAGIAATPTAEGVASLWSHEPETADGGPLERVSEGPPRED